MAKNYEIVFSGALGAYRGEVVSADHFASHGGVDRYLKMGAIKETDAPLTEDADGTLDGTPTREELERTDGDSNVPSLNRETRDIVESKPAAPAHATRK